MAPIATVRKLDATGAHVWSKALGNGSPMGWVGIATDASANLHVAGAFSLIAVIGGQTLQSAGDRDIFLGEYGPTGTPLAGESFGSTQDDYALSLAIDAAASRVVAGGFLGTVDFGPAGSVTSLGTSDGFVAKLGP